MTLKMASAQVVETSVTNNSPSQDSYHPDDLFQSRYITYDNFVNAQGEHLLVLASCLLEFDNKC